MRVQYHSRKTHDGNKVWSVNRLVELSKDLPRQHVEIESIKELDEPYWFDENKNSTCRTILSHLRLVHEADLQYPIILSSDGRLMDGMHRVIKAALDGRKHILAVRFTIDPEPDYMNVSLDDLPYE
jgi:hypothetical protein